MRILSYKNEKECTCNECGTKLAYSVENDVHVRPDSDGTCSVDSFLKNCISDCKMYKQLSKNQFDIMQKHRDWVCYLSTSTIYTICPVCGKEIFLYTRIDSIEIYPEHTIDLETGNPTGESYYWDNFYEVE